MKCRRKMQEPQRCTSTIDTAQLLRCLPYHSHWDCAYYTDLVRSGNKEVPYIHLVMLIPKNHAISISRENEAFGKKGKTRLYPSQFQYQFHSKCADKHTWRSILSIYYNHTKNTRQNKQTLTSKPRQRCPLATWGPWTFLGARNAKGDVRVLYVRKYQGKFTRYGI